MEVKYSKDGRVKFETERHIYTDTQNGNILQSVTSLVKDFVPPFDKEKVSKAYAKKHGMDQQEVLDMWAKKGEEASSMGTDIHSIFEEYVKTGEIISQGDWVKEATAKRVIEDLFETGRLTPIESELIVYNDDYAGQIDLIARAQNQKYYIFDFKTNKEITDENRWRTMLPPYDQYPDANYYHYALQLRIYQQLCKEYLIEDCFIIHLRENTYNILSLPNIQTPL